MAVEIRFDGLRGQPAASAAAIAQAGGEQLCCGFTIEGFTGQSASLNTSYEPRGSFGGFPLYRELGAGRAAVYYCAADGRSICWKLHKSWSEDVAREGAAFGTLTPAADGTIQVGARAPASWFASDEGGGRWTATTVSVRPRVLGNPLGDFSVSQLTGGAPLQLSLPPEASVGTLRQVVWARQQVEPHQQKLIWNGQPLEDDTATLGSLGVEAGSNLQLIVQSVEEAEKREKERRAAQLAAQQAAAVAQAEGSLSSGFRVRRGLGAQLNVRYRPLRSGRRHGRQLQLHGGMPVYMNGSPGDEHAAGTYFCAKAGQWHVLQPYTEEGAAATAACATIAPASGNLTVPMGTSRAQVFDGQAWQARDVRIERAGGFLGGCCAARAPDDHPTHDPRARRADLERRAVLERRLAHVRNQLP
eukprot:COSAG04_NODE_1988_length_5065_cov_2.884213_5_plen_416_part_00